MNYLVLGLLLFISSCDFFKLSISTSLDSPQTCKTQKALTQNEIQERLMKMRLNRKDRGFICLANSDLAGFYISQANVDRQVIKFLGFLGTDGLLAYIGQTEDELFTTTGFDSWDRLLHLGPDTGAMDPLAPMHLNWANVDITNANLNGMNIMETDLREVQGFSVKMLNELYRFDGAKLPAIDAQDWILTDKDLSRMDLSLLKNAPQNLFEIAGDAETIFPNMDISGIDLTGKSLRDVDLSLITGLSVSQLNSAASIDSVIFPEIDVTGWDTNGKDLTNLDLTRVSGLTVDMLNDAANFGGTKLPLMDVTGWTTIGKDISVMDLSRVTGLTVAMLKAAPDTREVKLPAINVTGLATTTINLSEMDLSLVSGFTVSMLNNSSNPSRAKLPAMDVTGWDTNNKDISGMDLIKVSGLTTAMLNNSENISGVKLLK